MKKHVVVWHASSVMLGLLVSLLLLGPSSTALGHDGIAHESIRTWTIVTGGNHMRGGYVTSRDDTVHIRLENHEVIQVSIADLSLVDQSWIADRKETIRRANQLFCRMNNSESTPLQHFVSFTEIEMEPLQIAEAFEPFVAKKEIQTRWDQDYFYVESNGIPDHPMMVGIKSWQQQVPLPQAYLGTNAWRIPLHPKPAKSPISLKNHFLRGAVAIAVNGVPIFNPLNNRGEDAKAFGELDEFGGHCGRADDYHYHIAPVHLEQVVGHGKPLAYALDGYPIHGYDESDGKEARNLDKLSGHKDSQGNYHYHATKTYPYIQSGFYGEVIERGEQVEPQPRSEPLRPAQEPLRNAEIVQFKSPETNRYILEYEIRGKRGTVSYTIRDGGSVDFEYVTIDGKTKRQSFAPKRKK